MKCADGCTHLHGAGPVACALMGKYKVPHFDAKGESNKMFADLGVPTTFLLTSFYS
jgi:hypothetical protein